MPCVVYISDVMMRDAPRISACQRDSHSMLPRLFALRGILGWVAGAEISSNGYDVVDLKVGHDTLHDGCVGPAPIAILIKRHLTREIQRRTACDTRDGC